jgi:hypothetical protein
VSAPLLATVVVSWSSRADALALAARFPACERHELVLVDNGGELRGAPLGGNARLVAPGRNLGFAGGANLGARAARAPDLLFLNPDVEAAAGAYDAVLDGLERHPGAAGVAPRLVDAAGKSQCAWQLRALPRPAALLGHALFLDRARGARAEPPAGSAVEQPAGAALALRRSVFAALGGFDERFHPAWFEDVDLARRLALRGERIVYWPAATFVHRGGGSLAALGYGGFLRAYDRNLALYLELHHGRAWAQLFRSLVPLGAALRIALLPLRRPRRARSRAEAARALLAAARGALDGWRGAGEARG